MNDTLVSYHTSGVTNHSSLVAETEVNSKEYEEWKDWMIEREGKGKKSSTE